MKALVNEILIYLVSIFHAIRNKKRYIRSKENIIIFSGVLGDSVMFLDALKSYISYFEENKGGQYLIIVKQGVYDFYKAIGLDMRNFMVIDLHKYVIDFSYFLQVNRIFKNKSFYMTIVPHMSISADILATNIASKKIRTITNANLKEPYSYRLIRKVLYPNRFLVEEKVTELEIMRELANRICGQQEMVKIPRIDLEIEEKKYKKEYFLIFPLTSVSDKNWEQKKIAEVIEWIHQLGYESVLACENRQKKDMQYLIKYFSGVPYVHIADTFTIRDLLSLIAEARLVIANDSAPNHIAAAMGIRTVCILGGKADFTVLPYTSSKERLSCEPVCVSGKYRECFGCSRGGKKTGYGNRVCRANIKQGFPALCVKEIQAWQVIEAINKMVI